MPTTCDISFDNPHSVYYAGSMLRGTVTLTLTKGIYPMLAKPIDFLCFLHFWSTFFFFVQSFNNLEKKVRGVFVKIHGKAYAHWTEHCSTDHNPTRDANGNLVHSSGHWVSYVGMLSELCSFFLVSLHSSILMK